MNHGLEHPHCHPKSHAPKRAWYLDPLWLTVIGTALLLASSFMVPLLSRFRDAFLDYLRIMWLPVAVGVFAGGLIDYYVPKEYISKFLAGKNKRTVFYSAGLGFLASACSHGIIALAMELHKKGASGSAVISFLLASPWVNLPITFLLIGFFGLKGFFIIFGALAVSVSTGLLFQVLDRKGWIEHNPHSVSVASDFSISRDISSRFRNYRWNAGNLSASGREILKGTYELAHMVLWWILIGVVLASLVSAYVPSHFFHRFLGPTFLGLLATLAIAAIFEVCSEGTSPLAFEIYRQTGAFGNAFAFLMGGVVTDYTEVGLVWMTLGKRTAIWMLAVTIPQVLLLGWFFNLLFSAA
jgi:uncharacterized membrane protein YraQ (UPF0718 family)